MKYEPPEGTIPLVATADKLIEVAKVTEQQMKTIKNAIFQV